MIKKILSWKYTPYVVVALAIVLPWLFHPGYVFLTDMSWGPNVGLDWTSNLLLLNLIVKALSFIFSVAFLGKILIGITTFVVLVGGRAVVDCFLDDKLAAFVVSLFALFNPFVYDRLLYGQIGIVLAFGFFLLATALLLEFWDKRESKKIILFGIYVAFTLQLAAHFIFFIGAISVLFVILWWKKDKLVVGCDHLYDWKSFVRWFTVVFVICVLLNVNWLVADMANKSSTLNFVDYGITRQDLLAFKTSGSSNLQVLDNVMMMSGFWGKDQFRYVDLTQIKESWGRAFLLLLPVVLLGIYYGIRKKETEARNSKRLLTIGVLILFFISAILAGGIAFSPTAPISYWLFDHFPLYKGLRESQKWVSVIVFVYLSFLSMGFAELLKIKVFEINRRVFLFFVGLVIIMQAPFLLWGYWGQAMPVQYPTDWTGVDQSLKCSKTADGANEQAIFLPWHMYMSFGWIGHIVANPAKQFFTCPTITSTAMEWGGIYDNSLDNDGAVIGSWIHSKGLTNTIGGLDSGVVKYIILAKELDWKNYSWLDKLPGLKLVKETDTLKVYERQL